MGYLKIDGRIIEIDDIIQFYEYIRSNSGY